MAIAKVATVNPKELPRNPFPKTKEERDRLEMFRFEFIRSLFERIRFFFNGQVCVV